MSLKKKAFQMGNIALANPIVVASCPATEDIERLCRCADAGAGAAILKSCHGIRTTPTDQGMRRFRNTDRGLWGTSTTARELIHPEKACKIINELRTYSEMPVIPSVAAYTLDSQEWIETLLMFEANGIACAQLDLFYLEEDLSLPETQGRLYNLILEIACESSIGLLPKMNQEIRPGAAIKTFADTGIVGWSILDSIRIRFPEDRRLKSPDLPVFAYANGLNAASLFGAWQFPLVCEYLYRLRTQTDLPILAGGGVSDARDVARLLTMGADAVQVATPILCEGTDWINRTCADLQNYNWTAYGCTEEAVGFIAAHAKIDPDLCTSCGRCTRQLMCTAIKEGADGPCILPGKCEGCRFCLELCPANAICLKPNSEYQPSTAVTY
ncbi:MAG: hypothetical protein GXY07_06760 [Candidatus Hydrogenedentes bacterium]|nr:hypothetical protein [Candidatus Hydrogenedentota bacterium]